MKAINPIQNGKSIRIKFTLAKRLYQFNPVPSGLWANRQDRQTASAIANRISNDIQAGCFDPSLDRYKLTPKPQELNQPTLTLLALWDSWVSTLGLSAEVLAVHYRDIRSQIQRTNPGLTDTKWLIGSQLHPRTINKRMGYLRSMYAWAVSEGLLEASPVPALKPLKVSREHLEPFSLTELRQILEAAKTVSPHYVPFITFLMLTGCRLSEAIGLRWVRVSFEAGTVTICESLSIDRTGNGYKRKMKATKTGSVRVLTMSEPLRTLLLPLKAHPDDLVFTSPKGFTVASGNLRRAWVKILKAAKVPYRRPHVIRHSFASHAIAQGLPLTAVSYLLGHSSTNMVSRTYGHLIDRPDLPSLRLTEGPS